MSNVGLKPRNKNEVQVMELCTKAHDWLAKELDIESNMVFGRTAYWGKDAFHAGLWMIDSRESVLNFRNLYGKTVRHLLKIIGHEARHAVQYKNGWMREDKFGRNHGVHSDGRWEAGYWRDEYYKGAYKDAPWEVDARAYEYKYADMIIKSGILTEQELDLKLSGKPVTYYDEDGAKQQIEKKFGKVTWYYADKFTYEENKARQDQKKKEMDSLGFVVVKNQWTFKTKPTNREEYLTLRKQFDVVKKKYKGGYRNDAIAFLTKKEEEANKHLGKNGLYWLAQKNIKVYKKVPIQDSQLVY